MEKPISIKEMSLAYDSNKKFKDYVDKVLRNKEKTSESFFNVFQEAMTQEYYKSVCEGGCNEEKENRENNTL